ncbi:MAG: SprB repeat-containing protein [Owenweeksia sp.]
MKGLLFCPLLTLAILTSNLSAYGQYEVYWKDLTDVTYDLGDNTLFYTKSDPYGNAFSTSELTSEDQQSFSFKAPENVTFTIGFVHTNEDYQHSNHGDNFNAIAYGFHFEDNEVSIYNYGSIVRNWGPERYSGSDLLEMNFDQGRIIFSFKGKEVFTTNFDLTHTLLVEALFIDHDITFGPLESDKAAPIFISYTTTEQDHLGGGSIEVTTMGGTPPYRYQWNGAPFVDRKTYNTFIPSLYSEINKPENSHIASEFNLHHQLSYDEFVDLTTQPSVSNLQSGVYSLVVIDADDNSKEFAIPVSASVTYPALSDYSWRDGELDKVTNHTDLANAPAATTDNLLYPGIDGEFAFSLPALGSGLNVIGIRDHDIPANDYSAVQFGFYTEGTLLYIFEDGNVGEEIELDPELQPDDILGILREENTFYITVNGEVKASYLDQFPGKIKRLDAYLQDSGEKFRTERVYDWWYMPLYAITEEEGVCGMKSSALQSHNRDIILQDYPYSITYSWMDQHGNTDYPNSPSLNGVDPGWYTLIANVQHPNAPYSYMVGTFYVGYKVNWIQEVNLVNQPTTNSLEMNTSNTYPNAAVLGESNSSNIFEQPPQNHYGWIYTELPSRGNGVDYALERDPFGEYSDDPVAWIQIFSVSRFGLKELPIGNTAMEYGISIVPIIMQPNTTTNMDFLISLHPAMIPGSYIGPTSFFAETGDRIIQLVDGNEFKLFINGNLETTLNITSLGTKDFMNIKGEISVDYGSMLLGGGANYPMHDQLLNCLASFRCKEQSYNLLAPELRAEFYNTLNGNLYFQFQGEYNYGNLDYVIRDMDGINVTSSTIITASDKDYGDNRYVINMNQLADGYYTLTVTNEKQEKYTLRIHKEY